MQNEETSILIAEDEPEILDFLTSILSKHFNVIYTANNGKTAEKIVREKKPDLILADIDMPEKNGIDFAIKMRAEGIDTPIIIVSGSKDREHLLTAIKVGIIDFIEKPFKEENLLNAVYRVLEVDNRERNLPDLINRFGKDSAIVRQHKKMAGLLRAISTQVLAI